MTTHQAGPRFATRLLQVEDSATGQVFQAVRKLKAHGVPVIDLVVGEPQRDGAADLHFARRGPLPRSPLAGNGRTAHGG